MINLQYGALRIRSQKTRYKTTALLLLLTIPAYSHGDKSVTPRTNSPEELKSILGMRSSLDESEYYKGWTNETWDGNNKPYAEIRKNLLALKKQGRLAGKLAQYRKEATGAPLDPLKQFLWVFAAWAQGQTNNDSDLVMWRRSLTIAYSPRTYDYARLRFAITAENAMGSGIYGGDINLRNVGLRLLKTVPNDKLTAYWVTRIRERTDSLKDKKINLNLALNGVKAQPKNAQAQANLANAYHHLWIQSRRRSDGVKMIDNLKKYLKMIPEDAPARKNALYWIKSFPEIQARWEAKGIGKKD